MLTDLCIYTIKHSRDLQATIDRGGRDTYKEGKNWVRARRLLDAAKRSGQRLPIVFATAEETDRLFAWALLEDVVLGESTRYSFSELQPFPSKAPLLKTTLRKASNGEPLSESFIRPYAICHTPPYLTRRAAQRERRRYEEES